MSGVRARARAAAAASLGALGAALGGVLGAACAPPGPQPLRAWSDSYEFRVVADPSPPRAREPIMYRIVVLDKQSKQVIDRGEGQIFASSQDRANTYDSFEPAREAGTYTARLNYITAGDWRVGIRFRRDSSAKLERIEDWVQTVGNARRVTDRPTQ